MRRNLQHLPNPPFGQLLAATFGTGRDDYLGVVLVYVPEDDKFVTWLWNSEVNGFSDGEYFHRRNYDQSTEVSAWQSFTRRSKPFIDAALKWAEWEAKQEVR